MPRNNKLPPAPSPLSTSTTIPPSAKEANATTTTTTPIFFYPPSHHPHAYLCQMYPSPFTHPSHPGITFTSAEQYMMYNKALTLHAPSHARDILALSSPAEAKYKAQSIRAGPRERKEWERVKVGVVEEGNLAKFRADGKLRAWLVGTGERELVEASPRDRVWGVGFEEGVAEGRRGEWGRNLLGGVLMAVRGMLRDEGEDEEGGGGGGEREEEGEGKG